MTPLQKFFLNATIAILTVTGAVFAWMKYFMKSDDPFAVANHPWQPGMLHVHVVAAPLAVFVIGAVWAGHVKPKHDAGVKARRKTGLGALWMIAPMALSGYLMQVFTNERLVEAMRITHWVSSALFVAGLVVHQLLRKNGNGATKVAPASEERDVW
ncbi:MAG: hypothetical protein NDJ92_16665 [Thermoanaerobaculia bacterium]|nr:hypothetical protein [Thermoanaerobaculia bacterium]